MIKTICDEAHLFSRYTRRFFHASLSSDNKSWQLISFQYYSISNTHKSDEHFLTLSCLLFVEKVRELFSFFEMTDGSDERNFFDQNPNILISKIDHRWQGMYIRDFWSIRWFRFVVPNVTYVSIAQSHPARVAFFCRWHTSFMFDKFLYSSSTMNYNMASIWSMSPRNYQSQHTQHSSLSSGQCRTQWLRFNFRSTLLRWHSHFSLFNIVKSLRRLWRWFFLSLSLSFFVVCSFSAQRK